MRTASSPTLRIAAGLLLVALGSVVGYQITQRLHSHGPEALLERTDGSLWPEGAVRTKPAPLSTNQKTHLLSRGPQVTATSAPLDVSVQRSIPIASCDSFVDFLLTPDLIRHESTLSRGPVASL